MKFEHTGRAANYYNQLQNKFNELKEFKEALNNPVFSNKDFQGEDVLIQITSKEGFRQNYRVALTLDLGMEDTALEIRGILLRDVDGKISIISEELMTHTKKENDK